MKAQVLTGSKLEIAEKLVRVPGEVREAIVFIDEPTDAPVPASGDELFAEMDVFTVRVGDADESRESIYSRADGE